MKNTFLSILILLFITACTPAGTRYQISGNISGQADDLPVYLELVDVFPAQVVDSTVIKNGKFTFKGTFEYPRQVNVSINRNPKENNPWSEARTSTVFFADNETISLEGEISEMPSRYDNAPADQAKVKITGATVEQQFKIYLDSVRPYSQASSRIWEEYLTAYHQPALQGVFNTGVGIAIVKKQHEAQQAERAFVKQYIAANPTSPISVLVATRMLLGSEGNIPVDEINEVLALLDSQKETAPMKFLFSEIEKMKKVAVGQPYTDVELIRADGTKAKLSEFITGDKVVMLEFWASWCAPCRGEIPHLKHVYEKYKSQGFEIVSVSLDKENEKWLKAIQEEQMTWTQLNEPGEFDGAATKAYNIIGVPACILINRDGTIARNGTRGAYLDEALEILFATPAR